jgi:MFS family permease
MWIVSIVQRNPDVREPDTIRGPHIFRQSCKPPDMTSPDSTNPSSATADPPVAGTAWCGVLALAGVLGLRMFGLFMVLPVLALHVERFPDSTPLLIGLALGIYGLTQAILQIPMGRLSDRWGRRPVILLGLLIFIAGSVLAAVADTAFWLVAGRALQGAGAISAAVTALVGDITAPARRTRAMALLGIFIGTAFLLAFVAGPMLSAWVGVSGLFWLTAGLGVLAILMLVLLVPERPDVPLEIQAGEIRTEAIYLRVLRHVLPEVLMIFLLHALLTAAFLVLPTLITEQLQLPSSQHGRVYLPVMLGSLLLLAPLILLQERVSRVWALLLAVVLLGGGHVLWLVPGGEWGIYAGLLLFFGGFNFVEAHLPARVSLRSSVNDRGVAMGWYATGQFFGAFVGGAGGGLLAGWFGLEAVACAGMVATALWLLFIALATSTQRASKQENDHAG